MYKQAIIIVVFFKFFLAGSLFCQPLSEEIKKMYRAYSGLENFYTESLVKVYADHSSEKPEMEKKYIIKKNKNNYLYQVDDMTMLSSDKFIIMVNTIDKSIFYSEKPGAKNKPGNANAIPDIDSLMRKCDSVVFKGAEMNNSHFVLYSSKEAIPETHLFLDVKTHLINKIIYYYDKDFYPENNKVVIDYVKTDLNPVFAADEFSAAKFIRKTKDKLVPVTAYAGYQIVSYDAYAE